MPLKVRAVKVDGIIDNIHKSFQAECVKKGVSFEISVNHSELVYVDLKKVEKIIWNLVSNAIKFTEKDGDVFLSAELEIVSGKQFLKVLVSDSGVGIAQEDTPNILNDFIKKEEAVNLCQDGNGIGLSIVNDLVELHYRSIPVDSKVALGTTFTVLIPTDVSVYSEDEIVNDEVERVQVEEEISFSIRDDVHLEKDKNHHYNLPILLLVEDNVQFVNT